MVRLVRRRPVRDQISWDPAAGKLDADRLLGVEAVINLNGATIGRRWTPSYKEEILASRVGSTKLLAETIARLEPKPAVLLCAGPVGIYGDRGDEILTEESELGTGFLAEVGKAWEEAAEPARTAGIRVVNFRQGLVLSRTGDPLARLLTPFKLGLGGRIGGGRQWWSWIAIDDLVSAYVTVLERDDLSGVLNAMSPNPLTNAQFVKALGHAVHRPTVLPLPAVAVRTVFGEMGEAALLQGQRALPARLLDAGFSFAYPGLDEALGHLLEE